MKLLSSSIQLEDKVDRVWTKLLDWSKWPTWDGGMESITFDSPINLGSVGRLKLKGGPNVKLVITEFTFGKSYTSEFSLFGTRYIFVHYIEAVQDHVKASVDVLADGATAFLFARLLKAKLERELPDWLETFKQQLSEHS